MTIALDEATLTETRRRRANPSYMIGPRVYPRVPDGWVDQPYTRFGVEPIAPTIGAVITGASLADPVDDELFAELNRALLEWKVLFFRDQDNTPAQHVAFAARWGDLEMHPFASLSPAQPKEQPEAVRIAHDENSPGTENGWHSDVTWRLEPSLGSVLRAIEVPTIGGDTMWADMGAAYDGLPQSLKERIDGLVAEHDSIYSVGLRIGAENRERLRPDYPPAHHPVVRTHPETGRKTLYVNRAFTQFIVGMDEDESRELLERLYLQASFGEYQCRWKWRGGDVAFWDNRSTQHYAVSDYHRSAASWNGPRSPATRRSERDSVANPDHSTRRHRRETLAGMECSRLVEETR